MEICIKHTDYCIGNASISNIINLENVETLEPIYKKIFIGDILNFLELDEIIPTLIKIKTKLLSNGTLIIEAFDTYEVCLGLTMDLLDVAGFNNIIKPRKQLFTLPDMVDILNKSGLRIISKDIDNYKHYIEVQNG